MNYNEYIKYHLQGDAGVEERMIASLCKHYKLSDWDSFRLIYFYTMTYHIPSALNMLLKGERSKERLNFRTDRRYVRCNGAFERLLVELKKNKFHQIKSAKNTQEAYDYVRSWFFFGRYAAFLFLEVYINVFKPNWVDNVKFGWEPKENYTKGAVLIVGSTEREKLDNFLQNTRNDTKDNAFAIETSLCAVEKIKKGTRWNGYYTERMLDEAKGTEYENIIYMNVK